LEEKSSWFLRISGMSSPRVASQWPPLRGVHTSGGRPCSRLHASNGSLPSGPGRMKSKSTTSSGATCAGLSTAANTLMTAPERVCDSPLLHDLVDLDGGHGVREIRHIRDQRSAVLRARTVECRLISDPNVDHGNVGCRRSIRSRAA